MGTSRIAAVIGDFYHEPGPLRAALTAAAGADAQVDFYTDPLAAPWEKLFDYGVLVMAREGRVAPRESPAVWNTERHEQAIAAFVRDGGGLVGLHACGAGRVFCFTLGHRREVLEDPAYLRFLARGIRWVGKGST